MVERTTQCSPPKERVWTPESIEWLAKRLGLKNDASMQDWAWEVADSRLIPEYMSLYEEAAHDDDVCYTLMDMIIQAFDDLGMDPKSDPRWSTVLSWLEENFDTHAYQIWYWSSWYNASEDAWKVSPSIRVLWEKCGRS